MMYSVFPFDYLFEINACALLWRIEGWCGEEMGSCLKMLVRGMWVSCGSPRNNLGIRLPCAYTPSPIGGGVLEVILLSSSSKVRAEWEAEFERNSVSAS